MSKSNKSFGAITADYGSFSEMSVRKGTVTQLTSITSGVTLNAPAGIITTATMNMATSASTSFAVANSFVYADSAVLANITNKTGNGIPLIHVSGVTRGSFSINVRNLDETNAQTGIMKVAYTIL
jgi:hypothetical protein